MPAIDSVELLQNVPNYPARAFRRLADYALGEGVVDYSAYRVTFSAGLTLNVGPGVAFMRGNSNSDQGVYRCTNFTGRTVTLAAADSSNPRLDQIVLQVQDAAEDTGAGNQGFVTVITGTPSPGATLDNRNGAGPLTVASPTLIVLADVLVNANNSPALSNSGIRDRRSTATPTIPVALSGRQQVMLQPLPGTGTTAAFKLTGLDYASRAVAGAVYLPTRIAATHFRWKYRQDSSNPVGAGQNYNMAICDASGRLIAATGNVAFVNPGGQNAQQQAKPFTPALPAGYMFEIGVYYLWFALSAITSTSIFSYMGTRMDDNKQDGEVLPAQGLVFHADFPGTTFDASNTILNMTDRYSENAAVRACLPVPMVALSIG